MTAVSLITAITAFLTML